MRRPFSIVLPLLAVAFVAAAAEASDREAIEAVVTSAYVEGIHNERDPEKIRAGFDESFVMAVQTDEGVRSVSRDDWIARIEKAKSENPEPPPPVEHEFALVDAEGDAAVVRIEIHRGGEHVFTDYLSLYRFADGWRIVGKIFHRHG